MYLCIFFHEANDQQFSQHFESILKWIHDQSHQNSLLFPNISDSYEFSQTFKKLDHLRLIEIMFCSQMKFFKIFVFNFPQLSILFYSTLSQRYFHCFIGLLVLILQSWMSLPLKCCTDAILKQSLFIIFSTKKWLGWVERHNKVSREYVTKDGYGKQSMSGTFQGGDQHTIKK